MSVISQLGIAPVCQDVAAFVLTNGLVFLGLMSGYLVYGFAELVILVLGERPGAWHRASAMICRVLIISAIFMIAALYGIEHLGQIQEHAALTSGAPPG